MIYIDDRLIFYFRIINIYEKSIGKFFKIKAKKLNLLKNTFRKNTKLVEKKTSK